MELWFGAVIFVSMELMYGNFSFDVWNFGMEISHLMLGN